MKHNIFRCHQVIDNITIFEEFADLGWVTKHRNRRLGAANGVLPIVHLTMVRATADLLPAMITRCKTDEGFANISRQLGKLAAIEREVNMSVKQSLFDNCQEGFHEEIPFKLHQCYFNFYTP